mgnify:CR=1 FL=1
MNKREVLRVLRRAGFDVVNGRRHTKVMREGKLVMILSLNGKMSDWCEGQVRKLVGGGVK